MEKRDTWKKKTKGGGKRESMSARHATSTGRQVDRLTERQRDTDTDTQTHRKKHTHTHRQTDRQTHTHTHRLRLPLFAALRALTCSCKCDGPGERDAFSCQTRLEQHARSESELVD